MKNRSVSMLLYVASYGPFVMNNQSQIMEAMRDYQLGKMGVLIEE